MALTKIRIPDQEYLIQPKTYSQLKNVPPEYMVNTLIIKFINQSLNENYPEYIFDKIIMTNNIDILVSDIGTSESQLLIHSLRSVPEREVRVMDSHSSVGVPLTLNYKPTSLFAGAAREKENKKERRIDVTPVALHWAYNPVKTVYDKSTPHYIFIDGNVNTISPGAQLPYFIITDKTTYLIYKSCKCFAQNNSNIHNQIYRYISNLHEKINTYGFTFIGIGGEPYVYANILQPIYHKYTFVTDSEAVLESCKYNTRDSKFTGITNYLTVDYNTQIPDLISSCKQPVTIIINLVKLYSSVIDLLITLKPYIKSIVIISCNKKDFDKKSKGLVPFYNFEKKEIMCPITSQYVTVYSAFKSEL